ncbi:isocitrate/isopropylmalate dehydrogenase family protein [Marinobacter sp. X15-166B]|uniref:isocitrate/isopropylmalate dehydrogenase family protein n=1 Tax=Marinobacter sp. X15-166B TaxID=1897620 RepID=UPI00085C5E0A|nr:isocitrate/isopropylmalate family dehydrogenase [Marinobacter sp. X15-166B]OEY66929.1 3-isopropylmalate dehydrogenase [Marinobacter sp. X15-166B]
MSQANRIAVIPGDGIGPEVIAVALRCLDLLTRQHQLDIRWNELPWPSHAWHEQHGESMPADALARLKKFDAILLGALGDPGPITDLERYLLPDSVSLAPLLQIRKGFDQWVCERPARLLPGARRYLADPRASEVDMLVIRENSEGEYVGQGGRLRQGTADEVATQMEVFTRRGAERIIRYGFEQARLRATARSRRGEGRSFTTLSGASCSSQVCLVTKRNALRYWGDLYTEVFAEVAQDYPDVATHHELVDAACMKFVQCPWIFDVVVASNLQGDILTDLAAVLSGGMGVAPSCNLNPDDPGMPSMFEPTHGSAPDIAGQQRADPTAMLLTTARLLTWLGRTDPACAHAGERLADAVAADLAGAPATPRPTDTIGDAICERLRQTP